MDYPTEAITELSFSANRSRTCVNISVFDDAQVEGVEYFQVSLSLGADFVDLVTLQPATTLVLILSDDQGKTF